ncbi:MAG: PAS domain S-box protein [Cytophagales bacterium]|nr:MAG: PAS domain S-box protein [Cytophagales bacterium]
MSEPKTYEQLLAENEWLTIQLEEANETIQAIRTGQIDALVVQGKEGHELYTLKTADSTYRLFIETMNEGAVTLNNEGVIVYANSTFASMVGMPLSTVIGLSFNQFVPGISGDAYRNLFSRGWTEENKIEIELIAPNRPIPCQLSVNALELDEGVSLSMILTDLTTQKESQQLLEENNRQLARINEALEVSNHDLLQFASVASHDLQEPLRKILIFAAMLRDKHADELPPDSMRYLGKVIDSSQRMKRTIVDILTYSRLSTNIDSFAMTDLNVLLADVLTDFELLISEKNARIQVDPLPTMEVIGGQIRQVFHNLINNAMKFSRPGEPPDIYIRCTPCPSDKLDTEPDDHHCCISVTDNGIGFDEQYAEKVFSLFHRLNTKDAYEGSGIGLAITKRIVDRHNGAIKAESREGVGSTFIIKLPLRQQTNSLLHDYSTEMESSVG